MNIANYASYFHDGEILDITHYNNEIEMTLVSAEIDPKLINDIRLSKDKKLKGKLHIKGIRSILNNGKEFKGQLKMFFSDNDLLHLKISKTVVLCEIGWRGRNSGEIDFSDFEIHATKIWWENIPDLNG